MSMMDAPWSSTASPMVVSQPTLLSTLRGKPSIRNLLLEDLSIFFFISPTVISTGTILPAGNLVQAVDSRLAHTVADVAVDQLAVLGVWVLLLFAQAVSGADVLIVMMCDHPLALRALTGSWWSEHEKYLWFGPQLVDLNLGC